MNAAQVINGVVVAYPYLLRPFAKQAHPGVSPLPGTWEQCTPDQLSALECVDVQLVARPELQAGESCSEGAPEYVGGQWRQAWVVGPIPPKPTTDSVPAHKWRMALRAGGFRAAYETHVTGSSANAQDYWKTAPYINRRSKFMGALRTALGITQRQLDTVFEAADTEED